ncbi:hypothetical protein [Streptomyces sp. RM72]|nr:hypothetical protein [Streptomyces sp. RM72]
MAHPVRRTTSTPHRPKANRSGHPWDRTRVGHLARLGLSLAA